MTVDGGVLLTNVYQPTGDGPWPVVVSFHGVSADVKDDPATVAVAEQAAAAGMVVFTPTWITQAVPQPDLAAEHDRHQEAVQMIDETGGEECALMVGPPPMRTSKPAAASRATASASAGTASRMWNVVPPSISSGGAPGGSGRT